MPSSESARGCAEAKGQFGPSLLTIGEPHTLQKPRQKPGEDFKVFHQLFALYPTKITGSNTRKVAKRRTLRLAALGTMKIQGTQEWTRYFIFDPAAQATSMKDRHV
jgi:hypothetical protein